MYTTSPVRGEQRMVLEVSYETYKNILCDHQDKSVPRFTYTNGFLEIVVPLIEHEKTSEWIAGFVQEFCMGTETEYEALRSSTFRRDDLKKGFEADLTFYVQNVKAIQGKKEIDLLLDPVPDLLFEVDITSPSLDKLPLYARLGVPELWWHTKGSLQILLLQENAYVETEQSRAFPLLTATVLNDFLKAAETTPSRLAWLQSVRRWAQQQVTEG